MLYKVQYKLYKNKVNLNLAQVKMLLEMIITKVWIKTVNHFTLNLT